MKTSQEIVTPVQAGVQGVCNYLKELVPAFAGMTEMGSFSLFTISSNFRAEIFKSGKIAAHSKNHDSEKCGLARFSVAIDDHAGFCYM